MSLENPQKSLAWYKLPAKRWTEIGSDGCITRRDSQRQKVYSAEDNLKRLYQEVNIEFSSIEEISQYVNKLVRSTWAIRRWGKPRNTIQIIENKKVRGACWARGINLSITLSRWGWNKMVVLHELSHLLSNYGASHGRHFVRTFLELVKHELGYDIQKALKKEYKRYGVRYLPKRELSEETRKKLRQNFKKNVLKQTITC